MRKIAGLVLLVFLAGAALAQDKKETLKGLLHRRGYEEAVASIASIDPTGSPGVCQVRKEIAKERLQEVIREAERDPTLPRRYAESARWLLSEIDETSPLLRVKACMESIQTKLERHETGAEVQKAQDNVIADLDKMIEKFRESEGKNSGGAWGMPSPNGTHSLGKGDVASHRDLAEDPEHRRAEAIQSLEEKFPKRYGDLVRQYFKSLAEAPPKKEGSK